ncbi:MAG TPA: FeoA family protein [Gammaproteobacteria bacterium]|nr:FeoA family protein [Gammaproteobacteria bacterium]
MKLTDIRVGEKGRVLDYRSGNFSYRQKLLAMGLTPGVLFEVIRVAPLGDPVQLFVRGSFISLRKKESDDLLVEKML